MNKKHSLKSTLLTVFLTIIFGVGGFYGGIYYGIMKTETYLNTLMDEFKKISKDVTAFTSISDPATVRLYVFELKKILNDIELLDNIIQSGQIADEALDTFLKKYQTKLNEFDSRLDNISTEMQDALLNISTSISDNKVELENTFKSKTESVNEEINKLYNKIDTLHKDLEKITNILNKAKETFVGKKVFN